MKHIKRFNESLENKFNTFGIDESIVNNLTDICSSVDDEFELNIRIDCSYMFLNVYESGEWTMDDNFDLSNLAPLYSNLWSKKIKELDISKLKKTYDIIINWDKSKEIINRIQSEYNIEIGKIPRIINLSNRLFNKFPMDVTLNSFNRETLGVNGFQIPVSSKIETAWIPIEIIG